MNIIKKRETKKSFFRIGFFERLFFVTKIEIKNSN